MLPDAKVMFATTTAGIPAELNLGPVRIIYVSRTTTHVTFRVAVTGDDNLPTSPPVVAVGLAPAVGGAAGGTAIPAFPAGTNTLWTIPDPAASFGLESQFFQLYWVTFFDDFNRADGPPGLPWITQTLAPAVVIANTLKVGGAVYSDCVLPETGVHNGAIQFTVVAGQPIALIMYLSGGENVQWIPGTGLQTLSSAFWTTVIPDTGLHSPGDIVRVAFHGQRVAIFRNGVSLGTGTVPLSFAQATGVGVLSWTGAEYRIDDFSLTPEDPPTDWVPFMIGVFDAACDVEAISIRHGRDDPFSQPEADAATLELVGPLPSGLDIGSGVAVFAQLGGVDYPRFTGRITDLALGWDTMPDAPVSQVIATGHLAAMGSTLVGTVSMPAEMDGDRANRVITAAAAPTDAARSDTPGTIHVIARPPDRQPALQIAQEAAEDGGGMLWETRDGKVVYADASHRDGTHLTLTLDPCTIPLEITWAKTLEGLINDVTLTYYESGVSYEQHVWDEASIAVHGMYATSLGTRIAGEGDAITRGGSLIYAQAEPAWRVANVGVHLERLAKMGLTGSEDLTYTGGILNLEIHDLVKVAGMPYGSPINPSYLYVEGWTETIDFGSWHIQFAVSDYCQTASAETWDEVDAITTWHTYEGGTDTTWNQLPCHPPPGA